MNTIRRATLAVFSRRMLWGLPTRPGSPTLLGLPVCVATAS